MSQAELIQAMLVPEFYPHNPGDVDLVRTHISYVFLAGSFVYKVKKAVNLGFLDFSTLQKRRHYCREELRLNRRLAEPIYLDVVPISRGGEKLYPGSSGNDPVVEYAVKMRRIPDRDMLHHRLAAEGVDLQVMDRLAVTIADFHARAEADSEIAARGSVENIAANVRENREQTRSFLDWVLPWHADDFLQAFFLHFIETNRDLLQHRELRHRIRDCHGDLRTEHICFYRGELLAFDCIEFNTRFRHIDVAADVSFLLMDLDYAGFPEHGTRFLNRYVEHAQDPDVVRLSRFYKCYYAFTKGKVAGLKARNEELEEREREKEDGKARKFFDLAYTWAARPRRPVLLAMTGLMGTGKSSLAERLAPRLGAEILRTDEIRKRIAGLDPSEPRLERFGQGIYSPEMTRRTYGLALQEAALRLDRSQSVIVDASFKSEEERLRAMETAQARKADFFLLECVCPEDTLLERLSSRQHSPYRTSDGRVELLQEQRRDFQPVREVPRKSHLVVDTSMAIERCEVEALKFIRLSG
jgi:hypothetical protein